MPRGREITDEQNQRLGAILKAVDPARLAPGAAA